MTVKPIVFGALGTITKGLVRGLEELEIGGQAETFFLVDQCNNISNTFNE